MNVCIQHYTLIDMVFSLAVGFYAGWLLRKRLERSDAADSERKEK